MKKEVEKKIYFTITGTRHYYGDSFLERGDEVTIVKDPDNKYDKEAIVVKVPGLGDIGHVANSVNTVLGDSYSAGRLYDRFEDEAKGTVLYITDRGIICEFAG